jgi:hypothetical protein
MTGEQPRYAAYMLRLWQVGNNDRPAWRAALESPHTGELHVFTDLEALIAFLQEITQETPEMAASRRRQLP